MPGLKRRSDRNTLERNEYNGGDMLAPLTEGSGPSKGVSTMEGTCWLHLLREVDPVKG